MSDRYSSIVSSWLPRGGVARNDESIEYFTVFYLKCIRRPFTRGPIRNSEHKPTPIKQRGILRLITTINNARIDIEAFYIRESHVIESNVSSLRDVTFEL